MLFLHRFSRITVNQMFILTYLKEELSLLFLDSKVLMFNVDASHKTCHGRGLEARPKCSQNLDLFQIKNKNPTEGVFIE